MCAMDFTKNIQNCAKKSGINSSDLNLCLTGEKGIELQLQAEKESEEIIRKSSFVPTVRKFLKFFSF